MRYPAIDPVLIHLGPVEIRWYGLMYVIAFSLGYVLLRKFGAQGEDPLKKEEAADLLGACVIGILVGARLGYCLFYHLPFYVQHPFRIFALWEGGMSFHGGLAGAAVSGWIFSHTRNRSFWALADPGALVAPVGLFFGRLGNFINAELYGRVTTMPWGMVFPGAGDQPRHPSQLYEAVLEGPLLFVLLLVLRSRKPPRGCVFAAFLSGYGLFRFFLEFFREPDAQLGFILGPFSMGQMLSAIMLGLGLLLCGMLFLPGRKKAS